MFPTIAYARHGYSVEMRAQASLSLVNFPRHKIHNLDLAHMNLLNTSPRSVASGFVSEPQVGPATRRWVEIGAVAKSATVSPVPPLDAELPSGIHRHHASSRNTDPE
jgi:hypothetical protein